MSGRGRGRGKGNKGQDRQDRQDPLPGQRAGQRSGPGDQPFVAAPPPATSAWGNSSGNRPAPPPATSAWGAPLGNRPATQSQPFVAAPPPATSAWGNSSGNRPAPPPATSAWGRPSSTSAGPSTSNWPAAQTQQQRPAQPQQQQRSAQPQQQPRPTQPQQQQQRPPQSQQQQSSSSTSSGAGGSNGGKGERSGGKDEKRGAVSDRGGVRSKERFIPPDIINTKPETLESKRGHTGQVLKLQTNYFRLIKKPNWNIYQYRVDFAPDSDRPGLRQGLIRAQRANLGGYLFDGTMLFLTSNLPNEVTEFMAKDNFDDSPIQIKIKYVGSVSMCTSASVQILNLILRRSMGALNLQLVGRNFFDALARIDIPEFKLQLWPGYQTSIRQHEVDILLCADVAHKVMRTETVYNIIQTCIEARNDYRTAVADLILGMTVLTTYTDKTFKITDIDWNQTPQSTFKYKDTVTSYIDYYQQKYAINIRDPRQPLLVAKSSARSLRAGEADFIALIPELCRATGLTPKMIADFRLMAAVAEHTRLTPSARISRLIAFNRRLQNTPASINNLKEWNFVLDQNLMEVQGRVLPSESIIFANGKTVKCNVDADWARDFRNIAMFTSQHLTNWVIIYPRTKGRETRTFLGIMSEAARGMRYNVAEPIQMEIAEDRVQAYGNKLEDAVNRNPQLIMVIVTSNRTDLYSLIKKKLCVEHAIPSQVMNSKTITPKYGKDSRSLLTVGTKVVIQINSKLGGAPWMIEIPLSGLMVIGFDVCHDTKDKNKSYGAMVATMDMKKSQNYFSTVSAHERGTELHNEFAMNITKALLSYLQTHGVLPERIMIYRDGVGEGQTNFVFEHEIKTIRTKLDEIYKGAPYKLLFTVVSKRINTRFFDKGQNPKPGTVVDDGVTLPERYDYFLVSQSVRQGTVSPTNYNILYDSMKIQPDKLQIFTYKMTHLYYNWTGTLRVPAVCQYAHKLAFLVGNYIHQSPSALLEKQLYFL